MKLDAVMDEAAAVLREISGLNVSAYPPGSLTAPAGYVSYPTSIDLDEAYGRGEDRFTDLPLVLLAGKATDRAARDTVAAWSAGSGPRSVKAHMEAHAWASCDDLTVTSVEFDVETIAGVPYLAAMFKATVVGPGEG
ncbi:hypothetical protein AB0M02_44230 [Actinoplanes sp. NPDC051861]|uniref:hypothetical protein n=1 Tax=Actinoplanes sp. NPDC051861 TaxID=3155170 RepID=UPI00341B7B8D